MNHRGCRLGTSMRGGWAGGGRVSRVSSLVGVGTGGGGRRGMGVGSVRSAGSIVLFGGQAIGVLGVGGELGRGGVGLLFGLF